MADSKETELASSEILINQLFAGRYLSEGNNIGHEVINLFDDDDGVRHLFITPNSTVKGHNVESVIFVRNVKSRKTVEVIAIGMDLSPADNALVAKVRYGGVPLERIFRGNTYRGERDLFTGYATYEAGRVLLPAGDTRVLITIDDGFDLSSWPGSLLLRTSKKVVIPQGMRSYFSAESEPEAHEQLAKLISDESLWEPAGATGRLVADGSASAQGPTFLEVIGKEDDELAFSNLLAYYFDYSHAAFREFASSEELLALPDMGAEFTIVRESNFNVDLWIEDDSHVVVIENKIRSGVNGYDGVGRSQLDKYRAKAEEYARSCGKRTHYYAFVPDHNSTDFALFDPDGTYKVIPYSAIYRFFARHAASYIADRYFPEFLRGLERQSLTMSELNFRTMRSRFMMKIAQAQ